MLSGLEKSPLLYIDPSYSIVAYNKEWQYPAQTEKAAFESIIKYKNLDQETVYIGFPWATLIDGLRTSKYGVELLLLELNYIKNIILSLNKKRVVTVCQHIYMKDFIQYFSVVGITDIFWTHKLKTDDVFNKIKLHGFSLFPAQTMEQYKNILYQMEEKYIQQLLERKPKYLVNFIGAYNPDIYLSDVRAQIFKDKEEKSFYIVERKEWHFNRIVYRKQMNGVQETIQELIKEEENTAEYLETMLWSDFTFCPTGSGPNSIRIYESLCLGSIPVILTNTLDLIGPVDLWAAASIIVPDNKAGYDQAKKILQTLSTEDKQKMKVAGLQLLKQVGPDAYASLILSSLK